MTEDLFEWGMQEFLYRMLLEGKLFPRVIQRREDKE